MKRIIRITALITALLAACICAQAAQVLEDGAAGETVMVLTRRLSELGFIGDSVSEYDAAVRSAVADFQTANGLERTGVADIATQQLMNSEDAVTRSEFIGAFAGKYAGRSLTSGASGDAVTDIQKRLAELDYYSNNPDGVFGEGTRRAVADYQQANGLDPTGIADASTLMRLYDGESVRRDDYVRSQCCARGDSGAKVRALQERLSELGYYSGDHTGTYGDNTSRAVVRFQNDNGLTPSGIVDVITYEALFDPNAAPAPDNGVMYPGDTGDDVYLLQQRLKLLGYYEPEPDGVYDYETETAVLLFRIANALELSVNADPVFSEMLTSETALASDALVVTESLTDAQREGVCEAARTLVGTRFEEEDSLFTGDAFVRYVFAECGAVTGALNEAAALLSEPEAALADMQAGDIVVLGQADDETLLICFAVCTGPDCIVYVDRATGTVTEASIDQVHYVSAYVWKMN